MSSCTTVACRAFRSEEILVSAQSPIAGRSIRRRGIPLTGTGSSGLALQVEDERFNTDPSPDTSIEPGQVLIAIGTPAELDALSRTVNA